jgi:hypothetical protein
MKTTISTKADFYVAPDGADANPGTKEAPFGSINRARLAVRDKIAAGADGDITVLLRNGTYRMGATLVFDPDDSARNGAMVTYAAYPDEHPVMSGGMPVSGWQRLTDRIEGTPDGAIGKIWVADIPQHNGQTCTFSALFDREGLLDRACSPRMHTEKDEVELTSRPPKELRHRLRELHFRPGDMKAWSNVQDIELFLTPRNPWTVNYLALESIDVDKGIAKTTLPGTYPLVSYGGWDILDAFYRVENVIDFLDAPGRWVVDTNAGKIYLWPREPEPEDIVIPVLTELVLFSGQLDANRWSKNITLTGIAFRHGDRMRWAPERVSLQHDWEQYDEPNALVRLRGSENIKITDCLFEHGGGGGVRLDLHAIDNCVCHNEIRYVGGTGIVLAGYGPGTRDENHHNEISFNHIHHAGRLWWHSPAIFLSQSGHNRISNNLIHNMPYCGVIMSGLRSYVFDMTVDQERHDAIYEPDDKALTEGYRSIRWDEVGHVPFNTGKYTMVDTRANVHSPVEGVFRQGFIHSRQNLVEHNEIHHVMELMGDGNGVYVSGTGWGNVYRRNYIHDIEGAGNVAALRLDDETYFTQVTENVVWRINGSGLTNKNINIIENNIVVDCYGTPPAGYVASRHIGPCYSAGLRRNIVYKPADGHAEQQDFYVVTPLFKEASFDTNILYCEKHPEMAAQAVEALHEIGMGQRCIAADPLFVDPSKGDFRLKAESPAIAAGFRPFDSWGLTGPVGPTAEA